MKRIDENTRYKLSSTHQGHKLDKNRQEHSNYGFFSCVCERAREVDFDKHNVYYEAPISIRYNGLILA